jgi:hypothetical protein
MLATSILKMYIYTYIHTFKLIIVSLGKQNEKR